MISPVKPFDSYKWHWLHYQPSEGLLAAPVFLGVLRTAYDFNGEKKTSLDLKRKLAQVEMDTKSKVRLGRDVERNLFRNSGQYWYGTGLLTEDKKGIITVTRLGEQVATGIISSDEFVALMIRNTVLPNPRTFKKEEVSAWEKAKLRIKPFELILGVIGMLSSEYGLENSYLTPKELIAVLIPLAGNKVGAEEIASYIMKTRSGKLSILTIKNVKKKKAPQFHVDGWPNYVPQSNDSRLAREFLLFLANFDVLRIDKCGANVYEHKYFLDVILQLDFETGQDESYFEDPSKTQQAVQSSKKSNIPNLVERQRVVTNSLYRPGQAKFRTEVFDAADGKCLISGEGIQTVLEAAHIIPVGKGGSDEVGNGFCLRIDLHKLYDAGKIRIHENGIIAFADEVKRATSYSGLPSKVVFPKDVNKANIVWRNKYL